VEIPRSSSGPNNFRILRRDRCGGLYRAIGVFTFSGSRSNERKHRIRGVVNLRSMWVFGVFLEMAKRMANTRDSVVKIFKSIFVKKNNSQLFSKQKNFVTVHPPISMHIDAAILREQIPHQHQPLVDHRDETVRPSAPSVPVRDLFQNSRRFRERLVTDLDAHREVHPDIKRRIDVDQLDAALLLDLFPEGSVLQAGEDELVVTPDQLVRPAFELPAPVIIPDIEHLLDLCVLSFSWLIHRFDDLEWEDGCADFICFSVPDQFDFAFFAKEEESVGIGKRFSFVMVDVPDFVIGEFHGGCSLIAIF